MARISGVDLPKNKRGEIGLTYIYGIGNSSARKILKEAGVDVLPVGTLATTSDPAELKGGAELFGRLAIAASRG